VKRNNTRRQKTLAYNVHHVDDGTDDQRSLEILFESTDFRDLDSSIQPAGQKYLIANVIKDNRGLPMSTQEIAEQAGISQASVRVVISRSKDFFHKVDGKIALISEGVEV